MFRCLIYLKKADTGFEINSAAEAKTGGADEADNIIVNPSGYPSVYHHSSGRDNATLSLDPESKKFSFSFSLLSSYVAVGTYEEDGTFIAAHTEDGNYQYTFKKSGQNIVFAADKSSPMPSYAYFSGAEAEICLTDGAVFQITGK